MMKTITLNVTCKYDVELTCDVPDRVYEQLCDIYDNGGTVSDSELYKGDAANWLADNVSERDALNWEYEINDINEE